METTYSIKLIGAQTAEAHAVEMDAAEATYRSLDRAQKAASRACVDYDLRGEIYDAQGSLVLRVSPAGYRAP